MAVETNVFRPSVVAQSLRDSSVPDAVTTTQYAQERFLATSLGLSNPPFRLTSDRNRLVENGGSISRGYIRRSDINTSDETSPYRLYFMFNPEMIQRSYIAYLDQQSLDPGNALFGSNNMAAPPGILDFSFELLFDRQLEVASDPANMGTKVDYDYFDLVIRGVVPDSTANGNAIPDNGIMMVNPHNILVVFGQDLSVQGRVTNASVNFEKFNNQMVPERLRIGIQMKALYIGPVQTVPNYSLYTSEAIASATIPYENSITVTAQEEAVKTARLSKATDTKNTTTSGFSSVGTSDPAKFVSGTGDESTFAVNLLISLPAPVTDSNVSAIVAWERAEGGISHNNPLNTTQDMPGATNFNSVGVKTYVDITQGLQATVITLKNGLYGPILDALAAGTSSCAVAHAITQTPWGTGELVIEILGC